MDIVKKENQTRYTIKAPGKCLLTGGYLILHPNQKGLSVSVDAYTQAMIQIKLTQSSSSIIHIHSIDMNETWNYEVLENGTIKTFQENTVNPYLFQSIDCILQKQLPHHIQGKEFEIEIQNCNGFYYNNCKTGFGTSSTTVVSLVTALLVGWNVFSLTDGLCEEDRSLIAEISLQAHFNAQGKVGSGYDIITAIYGSCVFEKKMNAIGCTFTPFTFPSSLQIVFSCGGKQSSKTSTFVKAIEQWRKENATNEEVQTLWNQYKENNDSIISILSRNDTNMTLLKSLFNEKLEIMYTISQLSNVEIIPELLYDLMKTTNQLENVVGCIVAGAGGYDSFYCIFKPVDTIEQEINEIWNRYGYSISTVKQHGNKLIISYYCL